MADRWFTHLQKYLMRVVVVVMLTTWLGLSLLVLALESGAPGAQITSISEALWWGFVTILTVGYGDYVPLTEAGRLAASLLMISGVVMMGLLTAKLSSILLKQILKEEKRMLDPDALNNHFIICGWKEDMINQYCT